MKEDLDELTTQVRHWNIDIATLIYVHIDVDVET